MAEVSSFRDADLRQHVRDLETGTRQRTTQAPALVVVAGGGLSYRVVHMRVHLRCLIVEKAELLLLLGVAVFSK